jgi:hypothetical protein
VSDANLEHLFLRWVQIVRMFTPLLDDPLEGPVYLRSSNHNLPDAAASASPSRTSPTPRSPRSSSTCRAAKKGLVVNSQNLCAKTNRANVQTRGHNGRRHSANTPVKASGCKGKAARSSRR